MENGTQNALIDKHFRLIQSIARLVKAGYPGTFTRGDLENEGVLALVACRARYDSSRGSFRNFARFRIHGAMLDYARSNPLAPRQDSDEPIDPVDPGGLPDAQAMAGQQQAMLAIAQRVRMPRKERAVMNSLYRTGRTVMATARQLHVSHPLIIRLRDRGLSRMRRSIETQTVLRTPGQSRLVERCPLRPPVKSPSRNSPSKS